MSRRLQVSSTRCPVCVTFTSSTSSTSAPGYPFSHDVTALGLATAVLCRQPKRMMAGFSPKHLFVMLLAIFLTAWFSMSAAQASVMSATMRADDGMATPANAGMRKMADVSMKSDRKACFKETGDNGNPMHCPPTS